MRCTDTTCRYVLIPLGSSTKIARVDGARTLTHYNLFSDESFSLFPRRNFNMALKAFLQCVDEAGKLILLHSVHCALCVGFCMDILQTLLELTVELSYSCRPVTVVTAALLPTECN
jgi:hypothetical protein